MLPERMKHGPSDSAGSEGPQLPLETLKAMVLMDSHIQHVAQCPSFYKLENCHTK